jgi:putative oxidoreductase
MLDQARATWASRVLSMLRFMSGLLFLQHGTAKYLNFPHVAAFDSMTWSSMIGLGGIVELITGALLTVGLFTPVAAFLASGEMAIGYFSVQAPLSFFPIVNRGELAVLWCFVFFYLAFAGGGPWSLDALLKRNKG